MVEARSLHDQSNRNPIKVCLFILLMATWFVVSVQSLECTFQNDGITIGDNDEVTVRNIANTQDGTVTVEVTYAGQGWVGFGFSKSTEMVPANAVIGLPDSGSVAQYSMTDKSDAGVTMLSTSSLTNNKIMQNSTHTVLTFTKPLVESNDVEVSTTGDNIFIWAVGTSNALGYHGSRGDGQLTLDLCSGQQGTTPTTTTASSPTTTTSANAPAPTPTNVSSTSTSDQGDDNDEDEGDNKGSDSTNSDSANQADNSKQNATSPGSSTNAYGGVDKSLTVTSGVNVGFKTNPVDQTVTVEMTYEGLVWISIAFSDNGNMVGSAAVIGLASAGKPQKYDMTSKLMSGVSLAPDTYQATLSDTDFQQNGTHTYMRFTRPLVDPGSPTVNLDGSSNIFLYAYGSSNDFSIHADANNFALSLAPCDPSVDASCDVVQQLESANHSLWRAHGICMALAWVILIPLGIGSSLLRNLLPAGGVWFKLHRGLNMIGILLTIVGFALAVYAINDESAPHFTGSPHETIGLVVTILALVQATIGILRPHAPTPPPPPESATTGSKKMNHSTDFSDEYDESHPLPTSANHSVVSAKTTARLIWEIGHRLFGVAILTAAWYNCFTAVVSENGSSLSVFIRSYSIFKIIVLR